MSTVTHDIVQKLWNLCNVLKDDGVTYHQYVTELTYLLFLKMAKETGTEEHIPVDCRWDVLERASSTERFRIYRAALTTLGEAKSRLVKEIFTNSSSFIKKPATLSTLVAEIDKLDWYSAKSEGLGDLYEGLLEKNANEKKSGAGQYFTPRRLIDSMVELMKPRSRNLRSAARPSAPVSIATPSSLLVSAVSSVLRRASSSTKRQITLKLRAPGTTSSRSLAI